MRLHLGIDDTDSLAGGCTTRIATDLVLALLEKGVAFTDYPNLVRLNPNVPWKTRGNGAVCLRMESDLAPQAIFEFAMNEIERGSRLGDPGTDPGLVLLEGSVPPEVMEFSMSALTSVETLDHAISVVKKAGAHAAGYGSSQGIIGAVAAVGAELDYNYTFELIAYRSRRQIGKRRLVDNKSVFEMDDRMKEITFNNIDPETKRVLITPRGPDPILCGVRGETPDGVRDAFRMLHLQEPVDAWMVFRTNQGTDAHLVKTLKVSELQDNCAAIVSGIVADKPRTIQGGHVILPLEDDTGSIECAAYEPTGKFREAVKQLQQGDRIRAFGGVRPAGNEIPRTINLEKLEVLELAPLVAIQNPFCPECGKRMKSAGTKQGSRCKRCNTHSATKIRSELKRDLARGTYMPPPRAHRHLTKPHIRYQRRQQGPWSRPFAEWHFP